MSPRGNPVMPVASATGSQAAASAAASASVRTVDEKVFGVLKLAACEIAIAGSALQEVVVWPDAIVPYLSAPAFVRGTFNLRGTAVPIVDLRRLLSLDPSGNAGADDRPVRDRTTGSLAIVRAGGGRIALAVDGTSDVLRPAPGDVRMLNHKGGAKGQLITALITVDEGRRIIQVLDLQALVSLPGLGLLADDDGGAMARAASRNRFARQFLFFRCDDFHFCLDTTAVREVIEHPKLVPPNVNSSIFRGTLRLRGAIVPVLDLFNVLALTGDEQGAPPAKTKLLIVDVRGRLVGLPVNDVSAIGSRAVEKILDFPGFGLRRPGMFAGVVEGEQGDALLLSEDAILLEHEAILRDPDVAALRRLHDELQGEAAHREAKTTGTRRISVLRFTAGKAFNALVEQVHEIIGMPADYLRIRSEDGVMLGILKRRGTMIPLIDLHRLVEPEGTGCGEHGRVLIVRGPKTTFGFVVDSTDRIEPIMLQEDTKTGELAMSDVSPLLAAASQIVATQTSQGQRLMTTLDLLQVAAALERQREVA